MKFSINIRGWRNIDLNSLAGVGKDLGYRGIELFADPIYKKTDKSDNSVSPDNIKHIVRSIRNKKLAIPCIETRCDLTDDTVNKEDTIEYLKTLLLSCKSLNTGYIIVRSHKEDKKQITEILDRLLPVAKENGVCILMKTTGAYKDTSKLRDLLDEYASDYLGVAWNVARTFIQAEEAPEDTITNLGAYIRHVHFLDSNIKDKPCMVGEGDIPLDRCMEALASINYDGFISAVWKQDWADEIDDPEVIFAHFITYMNGFGNTKSANTHYFNYNHTGEYIWRRNDLIEETFPQVLDKMAEEFPDQYAFRYTTLDYTRTYAQFRRDVDNFARALISMGVTAGTKVAVWATNVPAWYITFWATTKIGAILVTVNTAYKIHEAEYLLRQSDTHTLVMIESALDSNYKDIINELCPEIRTSVAGEPLHCKRLPFLRNVITVDFNQEGCLTFDEAMGRSSMVPIEEVYRLAANVKGGDVCNMQYTSGTTGFPKGVMLTHHNVVNNGKCIGDRMELSTADRMMIQVPMFHCFGMVLAMTASMTHGATLSPLPYFSAKSSLACINQEKITCFHGVPTMFIAMFNHPDYKKTDFSYMRTGIMAGSGCPPELMRRAADPKEMNMRGIVSVYGQTESSPGSTMSTWTDSLDLRCDTVGYAFPYVECKVIDPETGEEVPDGTNGEFCSRGYNTMKGYYKMPAATREAIDKDGWLHSGDLACRNEDGTYRITGRLKDMIIRGGENIYPKEIEEFIYTHPAVRDVQVIAVPDEKYGEEIMACIILKEKDSITTEDMMTYIREHMARHKTPRYIRFVDNFPMNAAGKVQKYKMREEAIEYLGL